MSDKKITCCICEAETHLIAAHLRESHPEVSIEDYRERFPDAPVMSEKARMIAEKKRRERATETADDMGFALDRAALHEVFEIPKETEGVTSKANGKPIPISVFKSVPSEFRDFVPDRDSNYIFPIDILKVVLMGLEKNINIYLVGHAGTGKSTMLEQVSAYTGRASIRVQHTVNTEEAHILGQYVAKDGSTVWEPGPLQIAMKYGLHYIADEYDRGMPQVLSVYQPVLEHKPLVTKEAPPEWRIVRPHENFRFSATGNTNGSGDDTGLYPGAALQDFANYERFGLMQPVDWMSAKQETEVIRAQSRIPQADAAKLVKYATEIRALVDKGDIAAPISPRALIHAAQIGTLLGSYSRGLRLAYINRLNAVDKEACSELAQRHFAD